MFPRIFPGPFLLIGLLLANSLPAQTILPPPKLAPFGTEITPSNKPKGDKDRPHEARTTMNDRPSAAPLALREPPALLEELPPTQQPEGNVWIPGYWWWDTDRDDFEWVKGFSRVPPPNQEWRPGRYYEDGKGWRWVPGFWTARPTPVPAQPERAVILPGVNDWATPEWYAPGGGFYFGPVILGGVGGYPSYRPYGAGYPHGMGRVPPPYTGVRLPTGIGPLPSMQQPFGPISLPSQSPNPGFVPGPGVGYPRRR